MFIKSDWIPPLGPPWIEIPLSAIRLELCSLLHSHNRHENVSSNLSRSEFSSIANLHSLHDVGVPPTDKNLGPALTMKLWYKKEVFRLLSDEKFYERFSVVPFDAVKSNLITILDKSFVLQFADNCTLAHFKILFKVHKTPLVGRPIVASTNYLTTPASYSSLLLG